MFCSNYVHIKYLSTINVSQILLYPNSYVTGCGRGGFKVSYSPQLVSGEKGNNTSENIIEQGIVKGSSKHLFP